MIEVIESESRKLLGRLRDTLAEDTAGQERLDHITHLIADSMQAEVCSIYLFRDEQTLELCATEGLNADAVHKTRLKVGEGLVGRVARKKRIVNTIDAPSERGFRYMPETGEEIFSAFIGLPIQRLGETLGVLVVQSKERRCFTEDEVYALEVVAMVLAEMAELGAFVAEDSAIGALHTRPEMFKGTVAQEGVASGQVYLHEPRVVVTNPVTDDPVAETKRLIEAIDTLRVSVDDMLADVPQGDKDQREILEAYRMFANSRGWMRRMSEDIALGLSAEAAIEKEQSLARTRLEHSPDPYLRERLHDLDDLSNRLLRILTGQGENTGAEMPENPILVARNIGPAELLDYGKGKLKGIILEQGSVGSHAAIVARAWAIPLIVHAEGISTEALNGDPILLDGERGTAHLRPDETVQAAFKDKMAMHHKEQMRFADLVDEPALTLCGNEVKLHMNAGLMVDLPSLKTSGALGVGLFRTELQFLIRSSFPKRSELTSLYSRVMDAADGKRIVFRTLDIGSDKVLPYMAPQDEPNPAMGWRAIRVGLDKRGVMKMQLQSLIRAANGRDLSVMFPFVAQLEEYRAARKIFEGVLEQERKLGHVLPRHYEVGVMLETPSLAFAPDAFFEEADFISIGGNDLKQFFFAADRENERVRRRYDTLNVSYISFLKQIVDRCKLHDTSVSFCGEDAGKPLEAAVFAAIGFRALSMRPASIGPVKSLMRGVDLGALNEIIEKASREGKQSIREDLQSYLAQNEVAY